MPRPRTRPNITFHWAEPDADQTSRMLLELSLALDDFKKPLLATAEIMRSSTDDRFKTGTDPGGRAWEPWAPSYEEYAMRNTKGRRFGDRANLHLTGMMRAEVTDPAVWRSTNREVFFDTSGIDDKWAWHNFGAYERMAPSGEPNPLPERAFIGIAPNSPAWAKINIAWDRWVKEEVTVATSAKGTPYFRRTKKGMAAGVGRL
jgi:Phage virion morphogenesis family